MNVNVLEYLNDILKGTKVRELSLKYKTSVITLKRPQEEIDRIFKKDEDKKIRKEKVKAKEIAKDEKDAQEEKIVYVNSKTVGVFYRGKTKIAAPLVKEGSSVKKGDQLGIINCMGVIEKVVAKTNGTIKEVLVNNHKPVEYGQPLFTIQIEEEIS